MRVEQRLERQPPGGPGRSRPPCASTRTRQQVVFRIAEIDALQVDERPHQQARADQQRQRQARAGRRRQPCRRAATRPIRRCRGPARAAPSRLRVFVMRIAGSRPRIRPDDERQPEDERQRRERPAPWAAQSASSETRRSRPRAAARPRPGRRRRRASRGTGSRSAAAGSGARGWRRAPGEPPSRGFAPWSRASSRLPRFEQAMSSTSPAAPSSTSSGSAKSPRIDEAPVAAGFSASR